MSNLDEWESTYELIGGFCFPQASEEDLIRELEHYNFSKKEYEQLSLF